MENREFVEGIFDGFLLWTVHSHMRFGDAARLRVEPNMDRHKGEGFIEISASHREYKPGTILVKPGYCSHWRLAPMGDPV